MMAVPKDEDREERIMMEIVVDAHDADEQVRRGARIPLEDSALAAASVPSPCASTAPARS